MLVGLPDGCLISPTRSSRRILKSTSTRWGITKNEFMASREATNARNHLRGLTFNNKNHLKPFFIIQQTEKRMSKRAKRDPGFDFLQNPMFEGWVFEFDINNRRQNSWIPSLTAKRGGRDGDGKRKIK